MIHANCKSTSWKFVGEETTEERNEVENSWNRTENLGSKLWSCEGWKNTTVLKRSQFEQQKNQTRKKVVFRVVETNNLCLQSLVHLCPTTKRSVSSWQVQGQSGSLCLLAGGRLCSQRAYTIFVRWAFCCLWATSSFRSASVWSRMWLCTEEPRSWGYSECKIYKKKEDSPFGL